MGTTDDDATFNRRALTAAWSVALVGVTVFIVVKVAPALLVIFGAILFALLLDGLTRLGQRALPWERGWVFALVCFALLALLAGFALLAGARIAEQLGELGDRVPQAVERLRGEVETLPLIGGLAAALPSPGQLIGSRGALNGIATVFGGISSLFAVGFIGLFAAAQPRLYEAPALALVPPGHRARAAEVLGAMAHALRSWLVGRVILMTVIAVLTFAGLAIVGVPLALVLAIIAGLATFIPFIGPILSSVPAILVGLLEGPATALSVAVVFLVVQLIESNVIEPVVEHRVVALPPAVVLAAQLVMALLFGFAGIVISTPLTVAVIVAMQFLYIEDTLGDRATALGTE